MVTTRRPRSHTAAAVLGDTLDTDHIEAHYDAGVLTLRLPITEKAKPRKIEITGGNTPKVINA